MKTILLAACGTTPQILTESLYALHQDGEMPHKVVILTTNKGKEVCIPALFQKPSGKLYQFYREYGIEKSEIDFAESSFIVASLPSGEVIEDIITEEHSRAFLKLCMDQTFKLSSDEQCRILFSLAGGRKTMGASLALAAQCYGRIQDSVFHVLVSPDFESLPNFFYPTTGDDYILGKNQARPMLNMRDAEIFLTPMPFMRLRSYLPACLLNSPQDPDTLFTFFSTQNFSLAKVNMDHCTVEMSGKICQLTPVLLSLLLYFILRKKDVKLSKSSPNQSSEPIGISEILKETGKIASIYRLLSTKKFARSNTGILNLNAENFRAYRAKLHTRLIRSFGPIQAEALKITAWGVRPDVCYDLRIPQKFLYVEGDKLETLPGYTKSLPKRP